MRPQGARLQSPVLLVLRLPRFNPRARRGRDILSTRIRLQCTVSIHAPAGGATFLMMLMMSAHWFQSTRPQGARRAAFSIMSETASFNPRARRGRDHIANPHDKRIAVSIHAPAGGATSASGMSILRLLFQSTRPQGARRKPKAMKLIKQSFNPRARRGRDEIARILAFMVQSFQSTRPQGARRGVDEAGRMTELFQSTRPQGARRAQRFSGG